MIDNKPTSRPVFLVSYSEIALKKGNRMYFENLLAKNLRIALARSPDFEVKKLHGRMMILSKNDVAVDKDDICKRLSHVFGVAAVAIGQMVGTDINLIRSEAVEIAKEGTFKSFAVRSRRQHKPFPMTSVEINVDVGSAIADSTGARVDLDNPEFKLGIEVTKERSFVYAEKIAGPGGLPLGSSGHGACLISGGIDSPVAAWRMMKRGCFLSFIHFHSAPFTSDESKEKVEELVGKLTKYQQSTRLIMVPFGEIQKKIVTSVPMEYRVVMYRRFMLRIANIIAGQVGAKVLVTGEALSQVASQTMENMAAIEAVSELPILRPLIGFDKQEIVEEAIKIGTYELSIEPHADCCSFLVPKHPATKTTKEELDEVEKALEVDTLVRQGVEGCETINVGGYK